MISFWVNQIKKIQIIVLNLKMTGFGVRNTAIAIIPGTLDIERTDISLTINGNRSGIIHIYM